MVPSYSGHGGGDRGPRLFHITTDAAGRPRIISGHHLIVSCFMLIKFIWMLIFDGILLMLIVAIFDNVEKKLNTSPG